jgi:hypothetical protein
MESMRSHDFDAFDSLVAFDGFNGRVGAGPTQQLRESGTPFTIMFAGNELLAMDCIHALRTTAAASQAARIATWTTSQR